MLRQKKLSFLSFFCLFLAYNFLLSSLVLAGYTYSGSHQLINDGNKTFRIKFKTSGTFKPDDNMIIDVFLVGGGSSFGGSGYTKTYTSISLTGGTNYSITVGAGGAIGANGTASTAFGKTANPGNGLNGGSGAGASGYTWSGGNGGSNGSQGFGGGYNGSVAGTGQGTTTREFGESTGTLYAGGGGGGAGMLKGYTFTGGAGGAGGGGSGAGTGYAATNGTVNTGGGAGLGIRGTASKAGGSGIVVIRFTDSTAPTCGTWSPSASPWKTSGTQAFTLSGSTDTGGSGISTAGGSCTTGSTNGATCTVTISDVAGNTRVCTSPVNQVDATAPECGTWSPVISPWKVSGTQAFSLSGSTDTGGSGIFTGVGSCTTGSTNGATCTVTISDVAGNTTTCTSPVNRVDATAPTCGTWTPTSSPWKNSGTSTFTLSGSTDTGGSGIFTGVGSCTTGSTNGATCTVTISDVAGNTSECTSPTNRVDAALPICGTWSPSASPWKVSGTQEFTLSGSTDAGGSGIAVDGGSCTTGENDRDTCIVEITDNAGNTSECTSPVNRVDGDLPVISNIEKVIGKETATITWETNEQTYSKLKYGLKNSLGRETNLSTEFSFTATESLSSLLSCTNYFYQPVAIDEAGNQELGEIGCFTTLGCGVQNNQEGETEASISAQVSNSFANDEGGSLELETETEQIRLDLPVNLHASSGANLLVFQIKQLVKEQVIEETGVPENELLNDGNDNENKLINSIFDLKAYLNTDERLSEFDEPIMISLSYTDEQVAGIDLSTLSIYRFDGSSWIKLETTVDQVNKRFIAYTNHFSLFAAFGQEAVVTDSNAVNSSASSNSSSSSNNDQGTDCSSSKPVSVSDLFQVNASKTSAKLYFTPQSDTNQYFISFSALNNNAEEHGEQVNLLSEGVQSHTIYYLKPNTSYYLKVRGQKGCAPGSWSNIMQFKTNEKIYYRDTPSVSFDAIASTSNSSKTKQTTNKKTTEEIVLTTNSDLTATATPTPAPTTAPLNSDISTPTTTEVKKWCFLWWCF